MRHLLGAVAAAPLLALTAAVAPAVAPPHAAMIARNHHHRACNENQTTQWHGSSNPGWTKEWWTANSCRYWVRAVSHCVSGRNNIVYQGKWVTNLQVVSEAKCTTAYPNLAGSGYDFEHTLSGPYTRTWVHGSP